MYAAPLRATAAANSKMMTRVASMLAAATVTLCHRVRLQACGARSACQGTYPALDVPCSGAAHAEASTASAQAALAFDMLEIFSDLHLGGHCSKHQGLSV